jgi:hypothetical protein
MIKYGGLEFYEYSISAPSARRNRTSNFPASAKVALCLLDVVLAPEHFGKL